MPCCQTLKLFIARTRIVVHHKPMRRWRLDILTGLLIIHTNHIIITTITIITNTQHIARVSAARCGFRCG
jgi:hypothetical protein